jgi:OFA family oxalate/formate antiporter-like MFS transporter
MENKATLKRGQYLLISALSLLFVGIIYAWPLFRDPLVNDFAWSTSQMALNFTITICAFCIGGILSGLVIRKIGPRPVLLTAAAATCLSFIASSLINGSLLHLYLSYGVLGGIGIGLAYNALISTTNAWFPDRKGLSSGIQMMAFGGSTLILGNIANSFVIPSFGWQTTYIIIGILLGFVLLLASFLQKFPPAGTAFPAPKAVKAKQSELIEEKA